MSTTKRKAGALKIGDRIELPKACVDLVEWKKLRYYRLPGTKGDLKAVQVQWADGPLKGMKAVVVFETNDMVSYVLKDPIIKRAIKYLKGEMKRLTSKKPKPEPEIDLCVYQTGNAT